MQGSYRLHYYRTFGGVRPLQAFTEGGSGGGLISPLGDAEDLSEAQVAAAARRLGLNRQPLQQPPARKRPYCATLPPLSCDEGELWPLNACLAQSCWAPCA
jgi:hypothetical protein